MSYGRIDRKPLPKVGFRDKMVAITPPAPEKVEGDSFPKVKPTLVDRSYVVLKKAILHPIIGVVVPFLPKQVQIMFKWIKERLQEPSTFHGINGLAAAIGLTINPELFDHILQIGLAIAGIIEIIRSGGKFVHRNLDARQIDNPAVPEE